MFCSDIYGNSFQLTFTSLSLLASDTAMFNIGLVPILIVFDPPPTDIVAGVNDLFEIKDFVYSKPTNKKQYIMYMQ